MGITLTVIVIALQLSGVEQYKSHGNILKFIFSIFPQFGVTYSFVQFARLAIRNRNWEILDDKERSIKCHFEWNPCCGG